MIETQSPDVDLIARFEKAAEAARLTENAYRKEATDRIASLALERSNSFRRLNLIRTAVAAIAGAEDPQTATLRARTVLANDLGWQEIGPRQELVLDRMMPVFEAVDAEMTAADGSPGLAAQVALQAFEAWYREETGTDFYALFDRYMPDTPRVDF